MTCIPVMVSVDLAVHHHSWAFLQIPVDLHYNLIFVLRPPCILPTVFPFMALFLFLFLNTRWKHLNVNFGFGKELKQAVDPNPTTTEILPCGSCFGLASIWQVTKPGLESI